MVYRGKPSAGCENCRKAKKRCTLEVPACVRCVKLKKDCIGYRDTTQLQIQDETQSVLRKVGRKKSSPAVTPTTIKPHTWPAKPNNPPLQVSQAWQVHNFNVFPQQASPPLTIHEPRHRTTSSEDKHSSATDSPVSTLLLTPAATTEFVSPSFLRNDSEEHQLGHTPEVRDLLPTAYGTSANTMNFNLSDAYSLIKWASGIPKSPRPLPENVAIDFFLNCCTAEGQWSYFHQPDFIPGRDSCLDYAIKACGMAALNNVRPVPGGREWSRSIYTKALGLLNNALRDPTRSREDDSLVAVTMLSFYENLVCDSMQSIMSWKAHIDGATQLLRLRGKAQFETMSGRQLFRELRSQVLIACIWDDRKPPEFLKRWQTELTAKSTTLQFIGPVDGLNDICFAFADLKHQIKLQALTKSEALMAFRSLDAELVQWSFATSQQDERWRYSEITVKQSQHVWNGKVLSYSCLPIPSVWNMYRTIRILLSRMIEQLARSLSLTDQESRSHIMYARTVRKQMTDDICATTPCLLGHAAPAFNSPCVLVTAYNCIWPLFFAATSTLEQLGLDLTDQMSSKQQSTSVGGIDAAAFAAAATQSAWVLSRLDHISKNLGIKWAEGIAASLREAIQLHRSKLVAATSDPEAPVEFLAIIAEVVKGVIAWRSQLASLTDNEEDIPTL